MSTLRNLSCNRPSNVGAKVHTDTYESNESLLQYGVRLYPTQMARNSGKLRKR